MSTTSPRDKFTLLTRPFPADADLSLGACVAIHGPAAGLAGSDWNANAKALESVVGRFGIVVGYASASVYGVVFDTPDKSYVAILKRSWIEEIFCDPTRLENVDEIAGHANLTGMFTHVADKKFNREWPPGTYVVVGNNVGIVLLETEHRLLVQFVKPCMHLRLHDPSACRVALADDWHALSPFVADRLVACYGVVTTAVKRHCRYHAGAVMARFKLAACADTKKRALEE